MCLLNPGGGKIFIILVYDIAEKRVNNVRKKCLPFLIRIENSVFIGDITRTKLNILLDQLRSIIDQDVDVIDIFIFRDQKMFKRKTLGHPKDYENIII